MLYSRSEILDRATRFAQRYACTFEKELGFGFDGIVFSTTCQSAIKAFRYEQLYWRERDVYHRLFDEGILAVRGFNVPRLIRSDDELWIVEMTIVRPPFVLDFAGAYLDQRPDYPDEVMAEWRAEKAEQFGENWPEVRRIMAEFAALGIYLADVKPGNIEFP
jgi:hypothetical protein